MLIRPSLGFGVGALCDDDVTSSIAETFLRNVASSYSPRSVNFDAVLTSSVDALNRVYDNRVQRTKREANELLEHVLNTTLPAILERHEKIEKLVEQTNNLKETTPLFQQRTTAVRRQSEPCYKSVRFVVVVVIVVLLLTYATLAVYCGGALLEPYCFPAAKKT